MQDTGLTPPDIKYMQCYQTIHKVHKVEKSNTTFKI
jgi:hypothetical protein